jgi:hypothetical protein
MARQQYSSVAEAARPQHPTPLQVQLILNPWQTASILHLSMADEASQSDLAQLALHLADVVAPSVQVPLHLGINPVGILHGNSKKIFANFPIHMFTCVATCFFAESM